MFILAWITNWKQVITEDKEKKLNKRIDKLEEEKKGLEEEICRMKLGF